MNEKHQNLYMCSHSKEKKKKERKKKIEYILKRKKGVRNRKQKGKPRCILEIDWLDDIKIAL